jgi:dienelactone hydrolase
MTSTRQEEAAAPPGALRPGLWARCRAWASSAWAAVQPAGHVRLGAAVALLVSALLPAIALGLGVRPGFGPLLDALAGPLVAIVVGGLIAVGVVLAARLLGLLPRFVGWVGFGAIAVLFVVVSAVASGLQGAAIVAVLVPIEAGFGAAIASVAAGDFGASKLPKRLVTGTALVAGLAVNVLAVGWLAWRGTTDHLVKVPPDHATVQVIEAPDPTKAGPFEVLTLTYGSGGARRPEFGAGATLRTKPVDATPFVKGTPWLRATLRRWYWGFDASAFPVNGRVWHPDGPGPFPLVLVVHGNHEMEEFSDPGYAYLGNHLASRGFIVVSVDENFFNASWTGDLGKENDGRGWMLLQHLKVWQAWSRDKTTPFASRVDMSRIALVGHSRGGESAAIAAAFNRLRYYPDEATVELPSGFAIRSVVAIAPSDGQYKPADRLTPLENVNYLTIQGGHDADVSSFAGLRQFNRVRFTGGDYRFKAAVFAYRANHGQFNTVWGDSDYGWPAGWVLNRSPLLTGAAQRRLARGYITAFLEATLMGRSGYLPMFRDERSARAWLPDDIYVSRFEDASFRPVATYEEDVDVTTATLPGAVITQRGLTLWKERKLPYRGGEGSFENGVVYLGWDRSAPEAKAAAPEAPRYTITLPDGAGADLPPVETRALVFALAQADEPPVDESARSTTAAKKGGANSAPAGATFPPAPKADGNPPPVDLSIELSDAAGHVIRLAASALRPIPPVLVERFTKFWSESGSYPASSECILQSFAIPLSEATAQAPDGVLDVATLKRVSFVFDRSPRGVVVLDQVGFADWPRTAAR